MVCFEVGATPGGESIKGDFKFKKNLTGEQGVAKQKTVNSVFGQKQESGAEVKDLKGIGFGTGAKTGEGIGRGVGIGSEAAALSGVFGKTSGIGHGVGTGAETSTGIGSSSAEVPSDASGIGHGVGTGAKPGEGIGHGVGTGIENPASQSIANGKIPEE